MTSSSPTKPSRFLPLALCCGLLTFSLGFPIGYLLGRAGPQNRSQHDNGTLLLQSEPAGASVFVNGRLIGSAPVRIADLPYGEYAIRLELSGREPVDSLIRFTGQTQEVKLTLRAQAVGALKVDVQPEGAEVLIDGQAIGRSPLLAKELPAGKHELIVRKANYESLVQRVYIRPEETTIVDGVMLVDKILEMLQGWIRAEPDNVSHCCDLGRYLFSKNNLEQAALAYAQAIRVAAKPLVFEEHIPFHDRELAKRERQEDIKKMEKDLREVRNSTGKDLALFREIIQKAEQEVAETHLDNWAWIRNAAAAYVRERKLDEAEDLFARHLAIAIRGDDYAQAQIELINVQLQLRKLDALKASGKRFIEYYHERADLLRQCANMIYRGQSYFGGKEREAVLDISREMLETGLKSTQDREMVAQLNFELGVVFNYLDKYEAACAYYKLSISGTSNPSAKDLRGLKYAGCLVQADRLEEAQEVYQSLLNSSIETIVRQAEYGVESTKRAIEQRKP